jgi:hypothetical protein
LLAIQDIRCELHGSVLSSSVKQEAFSRLDDEGGFVKLLMLPNDYGGTEIFLSEI